MRRSQKALGIAIVAALLLAACGGPGVAPPIATPTASPTPRDGAPGTRGNAQ